MTVLRSVRVAAIQATPVILDAEATTEKAVRLLNEAADAGAELAVLPECFFSLYPSNAWASPAARFGGSDELWERMWLSSLDVPGPLVDELVAVCRQRGIHAVVGANERESERPGTLYNAMLTLGPRGPAAQAPQAHADAARAALPRHRRGRRPERRRHARRAASAG